MASLYRRGNSVFWWVKFRDPGTGITKRESTKCRIGLGAHTRRAKEMCAERTRDENQAPVVKQAAAWDIWVTAFLTSHYSTRIKTLSRYLGAWKSLRMYLGQRGVSYPSQLTYEHATEYVEWRQKPSAVGLYWASRVTAIWEIKFLSRLMSEAIRRGFTTTNPWMRLGLAKGAVREKPEITDTEIGIIREALFARPTWMQVSFEIAIHQGCRFAETSLPLSRINVERMEITFDAKGGKTFTTKLHDSLIPLVARLRGAGNDRTYDMPAQTGREWTRFFRKVGLPHLCFHCTRVTVITRLCRANVSESQAMRFVGHASETIHRIYQRLRAEDVSACVSALRIPSNASGDLRPTTPARDRSWSSPQMRTDTPQPASPRRTKRTSSKRQPVPSQ